VTLLETVARILAGIGVGGVEVEQSRSSSPCSGRKSSARVQASDTDTAVRINNTLFHAKYKTTGYAIFINAFSIDTLISS
jgi:hypothetical protein